MATNRIASLFLLDVGRYSHSKGCDFFNNSKNCILKIILKKIFAEDNDEFAMVLFGDDDTNNKLTCKDQYKNINVIRSLSLPNLDFFEQIQSLNPTNCKNADWVQGLIVALDLIKETPGKRFKTKQIILFTNFLGDKEYEIQTLETLVMCILNEKIKVIVMGIDAAEEVSSSAHIENINSVMQKVEDLAVSLSFPELLESVKYFEKKRIMKRVSNVALEIGTKIKIPVGWLKLTSAPQRIFHWTTDVKFNPTAEAVNRSSTKIVVEDNFENNFENMEELEPVEVGKMTLYGSTKIPLSYGDLEALKRNTGLPTFSIFMFTPKSNINPTVYVSTDIYCVVPKPGNKASQAILSALIDSMIKVKKVAICKRIVTRNGKVQIGALLPFSDDSGKHLFFLKLPTAEWEQPFPRYRDYKEPGESDKQVFNNFIDSMMLDDDVVEEGKGVLVRNPNFQLRCHLLSERLLNPESNPCAPRPQYIEEILNPLSDVEKNVNPILEKVISRFPQLSVVELQVKEASTANNRQQREFNSQINMTFKREEVKTVISESSHLDLLNSQLNNDSLPQSEEIRRIYEES